MTAEQAPNPQRAETPVEHVDQLHAASDSVRRTMEWTGLDDAAKADFDLIQQRLGEMNTHNGNQPQDGKQGYLDSTLGYLPEASPVIPETSDPSDLLDRKQRALEVAKSNNDITPVRDISSSNPEVGSLAESLTARDFSRTELAALRHKAQAFGDDESVRTIERVFAQKLRVDGKPDAEQAEAFDRFDRLVAKKAKTEAAEKANAPKPVDAPEARPTPRVETKPLSRSNLLRGLRAAVKVVKVSRRAKPAARQVASWVQTPAPTPVPETEQPETEPTPAPTPEPTPAPQQPEATPTPAPAPEQPQPKPTPSIVTLAELMQPEPVPPTPNEQTAKPVAGGKPPKGGKRTMNTSAYMQELFALKDNLLGDDQGASFLKRLDAEDAAMVPNIRPKATRQRLDQRLLNRKVIKQLSRKFEPGLRNQEVIGGPTRPEQTLETQESNASADLNPQPTANQAKSERAKQATERARRLATSAAQRLVRAAAEAREARKVKQPVGAEQSDEDS